MSFSDDKETKEVTRTPTTEEKDAPYESGASGAQREAPDKKD
jgi:hypothetical protein